MVGFEFKVNKSFLERSHHPITIPRHKSNEMRQEGYLSYDDKERSSRRVNVSGLGPATHSGQIYYGMSGRGWYYQISFTTPSPMAGLGQLKIGHMIQVVVDRHDRSLSVFLLDFGDPDSIIRLVDHLSPTSGGRLKAYLGRYLK